MSHFVIDTGDLALASKSPLIKAQDRQNFVDSVAMLNFAATTKAEAEAETKSARANGYADGLAEARDKVQQEFIAEVQKMATALAAHETARHEQIATVAFAAAQAIVGAMDQTLALRGIVDQVIKRNDDGQKATVHVNPQQRDALLQIGGLPANVELVGNPDLGVTDCEIVTSNGKIIANMELQFAALAKRWSVDVSDSKQDLS